MRISSALCFAIAIAVAFMLPVAPRALAQSQSEMNAEAFADFQKADAALNKIYKKLLAVMEDDEAKAKLKAAQRAWVALRDAQAEFDSDVMRGGSGAPMLYQGSRTESTNQRIAVLRKCLEDRSPR